MEVHHRGQWVLCYQWRTLWDLWHQLDLGLLWGGGGGGVAGCGERVPWGPTGPVAPIGLGALVGVEPGCPMGSCGGGPRGT